MSCEVAGTAAGQRLREALRDRVVARLFDAIAPGYRAGLAADGKLLDGRISVRCYANNDGGSQEDETEKHQQGQQEASEQGPEDEAAKAAAEDANDDNDDNDDDDDDLFGDEDDDWNGATGSDDNGKNATTSGFAEDKSSRDDAPSTLGPHVDGRTLTLLQASRDAPSTLGPHVDGNIMTLLFADGPGLQVPQMPPANPTLTPAQIAATGMPTIGPVDGGGGGGGGQALVSWADVGGFWEYGGLLVTFGHGWTRTAALQKALPLRCPVLHRVRRGDSPRMSIPYLVRAVDQHDDPTTM